MYQLSGLFQKDGNGLPELGNGTTHSANSAWSKSKPKAKAGFGPKWNTKIGLHTHPPTHHTNFLSSYWGQRNVKLIMYTKYKLRKIIPTTNPTPQEGSLISLLSLHPYCPNYYIFVDNQSPETHNMSKLNVVHSGCISQDVNDRV